MKNKKNVPVVALVLSRCRPEPDVIFMFSVTVRWTVCRQRWQRSNFARQFNHRDSSSLKILQMHPPAKLLALQFFYFSPTDSISGPLDFSFWQKNQDRQLEVNIWTKQRENPQSVWRWWARKLLRRHPLQADGRCFMSQPQHTSPTHPPTHSDRNPCSLLLAPAVGRNSTDCRG